MSRNRLRPSLRRIGVRLTGGGAAGSSLDADAATLIAAMTTEPDSTRQGLIDDLIVGLKADGVWAELDELWVTAAHAEQAALLGWKRAHDLTAVNAPAFEVDRGFTGNGTTSYLNTNFVPSTDGVQYTLDDASFGVYSRTDSLDAADMGAGDSESATDALKWAVFQARITGDTGRYRINMNSATGQLNPAATTAQGLSVTRRTTSTAYQSLRNGVITASGAATSTSVPIRAMYIGAGNRFAGASGFSTSQYAAAFVGASMSEAQQLALFNRLETYLDAIGAGVVA